ncbi:MAG: PD-(D/E)XK nuclease family protein [Odoribacter sp.]
MASFLQLLAKDIINKYGTEFSHLTILFPNKRAGLFLAEELSKQIEKPVWMPEILTLSEYLEKYTGLKKADNLSLVIKLYKSYIQVSGSSEKFEDFYFWGNMLLSDFDDIDKYLADAADLFSNLIALKKLEVSFPYLTDEQIAAIRKFWNSFNVEKFSHEQEEFLKVWDQLGATYQNFKNNLFISGISFEGMNERQFCENIEQYDHPKHLLFAGFNALNACEKRIFSYYRDLDIASFYWDYDSYYTTKEYQEAGLYLRENLRNFPNELGIEHFNNFRHNGKKIEYIAVPSSIGQAKLLPKLTESLQGDELRQTAIVLCDEQMLIPAMHSIPDYISKINITMGYPAHNTSIASLISLLCDLKNYAKHESTGNYYYYKSVIALLHHKLIKELCPEEIYQLINLINQKNIIYVSEKNLQFHTLIQTIFSATTEKIPTYLMNILNRLTRTSLQENSDPIEKEFIFSIYTQIQNLQNTFEEEGIEPEEKLYIQIIQKMIDSISIPFSGEPLEGLQLMGLMETRMLDFKNLIILSANEGILPKTTLPASFIPYNLRLGFRLPTPEHQDSVFAYYFYRLLQRSKNIKILYTSGVKGMNGSEMSRFLYQIKYESGLTVKESNFQNRISTQTPQSIILPKDKEILEILDTYTQSDKKTVSPSALNTYIECPLKFYFKYIAHIEEKEEIAEELDHRLLGNIFHECSQSLYATIPNGNITTEAIDHLLHNNALLDEHIRTSYLKIYDLKVSNLIDSGSNDLILTIIKKYIREMFSYDKKLCPFRMLAMETRFHIPIKINDNTRQVFIGGYIDRVDQSENGIRVIDYKTGADTTLFKTIDSVFDPENPTRNKAAFQTMLYCLMYDNVHPSEHPLIPGIYSTKLLFGKDYNFRLKCDKDYICNFRHYQQEFENNLTTMLEKLFDPHQAFIQTSHTKKCQKCSYAGICRR